MLKVNGKAYDWGDVDLKIPGLNIQVQEISYDDELEIEEVYGSGSKPRGYGTGNYKASGKLSMLRDDYDDLHGLLQAEGSSLLQDGAALHHRLLRQRGQHARRSTS